MLRAVIWGIVGVFALSGLAWLAIVWWEWSGS
jgi:hypothetical protein